MNKLKLTTLFCFALLTACMPHIETVTPNRVLIDGNIDIEVEGDYLKGASVKVDSQSALIKQTSKNTLTFTAPAHEEGIASLRITNSIGSVDYPQGLIYFTNNQPEIKKTVPRQ